MQGNGCGVSFAASLAGRVSSEEGSVATVVLMGLVFAFLYVEQRTVYVDGHTSCQIGNARVVLDGTSYTDHCLDPQNAHASRAANASRSNVSGFEGCEQVARRRRY